MDEYSLFRTAIIRSLAGNRDIMRMAFQHTGISNASEFGIMQLFDIGGAAISHTCTQTAGQLINHLIQSSLIRTRAAIPSGTSFFTSLVPLWK